MRAGIPKICGTLAVFLFVGCRPDGADHGDRLRLDIRAREPVTRSLALLSITSREDAPLVIRDVIINNRKNENCDFVADPFNETNAWPPLPATLRLGDTLEISDIPTFYCGTPVKAEIVTDRGRLRYEIP